MAIYPEQIGKVKYDVSVSELIADNIVPLTNIVDTLNDASRRVMSVDPPVILDVDLVPIAGESGVQEAWNIILSVTRKDGRVMWDDKACKLVDEFEAAANALFGPDLFHRK